MSPTFFAKKYILRINFNCRVQPHAKTKERQITTWCSLVLKYQKHKNKTTLDVSEDTELFANEAINRKLPAEGRLFVLDELAKTQNAIALDKKRQQWEIYWYTLDEWANLLYNWAVESGQTNTVCTLFELTNGDHTTDQEFYGLDSTVLIKALRVLEKRGKCELIMFDDNQGVKFF